MRSLPARKYLKRQKEVKNDYLFSPDELSQHLKIINLFEKFDADGSGALDYQELCALYNENGVPVTEADIKLIYSDDNPKFTLPMFQTITQDVHSLRKYRQSLQKIKPRLVAEAKLKAKRANIPNTFDEMMLDFGVRVKRRELDEQY